MEQRIAADLSEDRFSALQRAEIAEMRNREPRRTRVGGFSALQRAEIAEIRASRCDFPHRRPARKFQQFRLVEEH